VLVIYTVAFATLTSRRSAARMRTLAIGGGCGAAVGALCLVLLLALPPLPTSGGWTIAAAAAAGCAAMLIGIKWADGGGQVLVAGLCASTVAALWIFVCVQGLLGFLPRWVPDTSPANVSAADRLANNRAGVGDHYLAVLLLGCMLAAALSIALVTTRRPRLDPAGSSIPGHSGTS
jgi:hypothetical protein